MSLISDHKERTAPLTGQELAIIEDEDGLRSIPVEKLRSEVLDGLSRESADALYQPKLTGWRDLTAGVARAALGASAPNLLPFGPDGFRRELAFSVGDYVELDPFHVDHDVKPGGQALIHVHWSPNGINPQPVRWQFKISRAKGHQQAAFGVPQTLTVTQTPSGIAWQHMVAEVGEVDALILTEPDELLLVNLYRVANGGTENTDNIFGLTVDFHYQTDRDNTPNRAPDFYA